VDSDNNSIILFMAASAVEDIIYNFEFFIINPKVRHFLYKYIISLVSKNNLK
jgi:hypothetical protein